MLSIVMAVYNHLDLTTWAWKNLEANTDVPHEFILIDNGSKDGTYEFLSGLSDTKAIRLEQNAGIIPAWNIGCREATGDYIAVTCNDVIVPWGWAGKLIEVFEADPEVWICSPQGTRDMMPPDWHDRNEELYHQPLSWHIAEPPCGQFVDYFFGGCFLISRHGWETIGEFDEQFPLWFGDVDYVLRAGDHNAKCMNVLIHHLESQTLNKFPESRVTDTTTATEAFRKKWGDICG